MAGLYIHIPFCASRCIYCGFYSTTRLEQRQRYVDAICKESSTAPLSSPGGDTNVFGTAKPPLGEVLGGRLSTIYLGGGTPSQLTPAQLEQLFTYIYNRYKVSPDAEVTMECNPDDVTADYAAALSQLPVNRVSMGAQTFDDGRLHFLHRRHTSRQVAEAVAHLRHAGIRNISIDLMYGFPHETLSDWERDIDAALALDVEHLSAYCLMYEEGTPLYEKMRKENLAIRNDASDELERRMYELLMDRLEAAGFEHYEISNWGRLTPLKGEGSPLLRGGAGAYRSRHNSNYWKDVPYVGLGAAAHSYLPVGKPLPSEGFEEGRRFWNVADLQEYMRRIEHGESPVEGSELIEGWTRYNDRVTVALRTCEGLDLTTLPDEQRRYCTKTARRFLDDGLLRLQDQHLILTRRGLFVSDMVMSELMYV
ncbi:MAG: radical SAM family heme chaperone HemW [Prevotella sp.]|nr:radical SAM family heme chaperone HemW [Prevotella sp.]